MCRLWNRTKTKGTIWIKRRRILGNSGRHYLFFVFSLRIATSGAAVVATACTMSCVIIPQTNGSFFFLSLSLALSPSVSVSLSIHLVSCGQFFVFIRTKDRPTVGHLTVTWKQCLRRSNHYRFRMHWSATTKKNRRRHDVDPFRYEREKNNKFNNRKATWMSRSEERRMSRVIKEIILSRFRSTRASTMPRHWITFWIFSFRIHRK